MFVVLDKSEKIVTETKGKGKNKQKRVVIVPNVEFLDLNKKILKRPIDSTSLRLLLRGGDGQGALTKAQKAFFSQELARGQALTQLIDNGSITRTRLHKMLQISSSTLQKLEKNPFELEDSLKQKLYRKIHKIYQLNSVNS